MKKSERKLKVEKACVSFERAAKKLIEIGNYGGSNKATLTFTYDKKTKQGYICGQADDVLGKEK